MQPIHKTWCMQIDITNHCFHACLYCSRYNRHLRPDQREHMPVETFVAALRSLQDWPAHIGIVGGEPLLHPELKTLNALLRQHFPKERLILWTSGLPETALEDPSCDPDIQMTYGFIAYNPHGPEQVKKCRHQPLTVAINEAVPDRDLMWQLIDNCWVQRTWCATMTHKGAYFCEVAAAQDILLNDGANAWPIEPGWWKRPPDSKEFLAQKNLLCPNCGMAIPMERELLLKQSQKMTPRLLEYFGALGLKRVEEKDVELFTKQFSREEIKENIKTWYPGNYREDVQEDKLSAEGRGFPGLLLPGAGGKQSLEVLTMWYNEAFLAPFFLKHYAYADRITLLYDADTTDNTFEIVKNFPNVHVVPFRFPDMMDDELKRDILNAHYKQTQFDWVLCVDADEFAFYKEAGDFCYDLRRFLDYNSGYDLFYVSLYQIYRNANDAELDPDKYPVPQRRHGDPNITTGVNVMYNKPILVRKGLDVRWGFGCHDIEFVPSFSGGSVSLPGAISPVGLLGGHWAMADPVFAIERRVKNRRARQSKNNLMKGLTVQHHHVTEESIMAEFAQHMHDPQVY